MDYSTLTGFISILSRSAPAERRFLRDHMVATPFISPFSLWIFFHLSVVSLLLLLYDICLISSALIISTISPLWISKLPITFRILECIFILPIISGYSLLLLKYSSIMVMLLLATERSKNFLNMFSLISPSI